MTRMADAVNFILQHLATDPEATIDELARAAHNNGTPLGRGEISRLRTQAKQLGKVYLKTDFPAQPEESAVIPSRTKKCARCGMFNHWASECVAVVERHQDASFIAHLIEPLPSDLSPEPEIEMTPADEVPSAPRASPPRPADAAAQLIGEGRKRSAAGTALRRQFVNELLDKDPGMDPQVILGELKRNFGIALSSDYVYDTCRVARELHHLPQLTVVPSHPRTDPRGRKALPVYGSPQSPAEPPEEEEETYAATPEEELAWLAKQAGDLMRAHSITELQLTVKGARAKWSYSVIRSGEGEADV